MPLRQSRRAHDRPEPRRRLAARKAGTAQGFPRYSEALKRTGVVWNAATDAWLQNPAAFAPGNYMTFLGIQDAQARSYLIDLEAISSEGARTPKSPSSPSLRSSLPDLKSAEAEARVTVIRHCGDTYWVTVASGRIISYW